MFLISCSLPMTRYCWGMQHGNKSGQSKLCSELSKLSPVWGLITINAGLSVSIYSTGS